MNFSVKYGFGITLSASGVLGRQPPVEYHGSVVVDMEKGHLGVLLSQNEENRIKQVNDFGKEEPPTGGCHLKIDHCKNNQSEPSI